MSSNRNALSADAGVLPLTQDDSERLCTADESFHDLHSGAHALVASLATVRSVSTDLPSHMDSRAQILARLSHASRRVGMLAGTNFRRAIGRSRKHQP